MFKSLTSKLELVTPMPFSKQGDTHFSSSLDRSNAFPSKGAYFYLLITKRIPE